ncbi:MAG: aminopeptidase, partial [Xanthomonadales bacterium]|nr:aminopeptidase [Xanthomonadales bacterium]
MKSNARNLSLGLTILIGVAVIAVAINMGGCASPAYYWQAASGHLSLMHSRQSVDQAIADESDPEIREKLRLSREIKAFAVNELALPDNDSYEDFVRTGRDAVVWNVVAAPEFSLQAREWCFPVAGCVPYRGYFAEEAANKFAEGLKDEGLDVAISPAIAYST